MRKPRWVVAGLTVAVVSVSSAAMAQTEVDGFAVNSFDPSDRGSDWFAVESLDFSQALQPTLGLVFDYARKPLVFHQDDEEVGVPISDQLFVHLGGRLVLVERVSVGLSLPVALYHAGETGSVEGLSFETESGTAAGDLRLASSVRMLGKYGEPVTMAAGLQLHFPTGRQEIYASDGKMRAEPRVQIAGDIGAFTYAGRLGLMLRARDEDYLGHPFGSTMAFGMAAGARLMDRKLVLGPELYGSTVVTDGGDGFFKRRVTPVELLLGGHFMPNEQWRVGLGVGPGLTKGWGSPDVRVVGVVEFVPEVRPAETAPPADSDGDGILDDQDACRDTPGVPSGDPAKHGCPAAKDRDGDTILDAEDACPDQAGPPNLDRAKHGCPLPSDRDADTIVDGEDACPDTAGVPNEDRSKHGCPEDKDRDKDGIENASDACPDEAGPANADPKKNGCPKAMIVGSTIKINERVEFDTAQATIRTESDALLNAVANIFKEHPEIKKVNVQGHTDNRGTRAYNLRLSKQRAAAVVDWLVRHGIDAGRLTSEGIGPDKPADTNETAEGRQNNRRVEFIIVERDEPK